MHKTIGSRKKSEEERPKYWKALGIGNGFLRKLEIQLTSRPTINSNKWHLDTCAAPYTDWAPVPLLLCEFSLHASRLKNTACVLPPGYCNLTYIFLCHFHTESILQRFSLGKMSAMRSRAIPVSHFEILPPWLGEASQVYGMAVFCRSRISKRCGCSLWWRTDVYHEKDL